MRSIHTGSLYQLYDTYVTQALERHRPHQQALYTPQQTRKWLAYLAGRLAEREQAVYLIEQMQPDWLEPREGQSNHNSIKERLLSRLVGKGEIEITDTQWSWSAAVASIKDMLSSRPISMALIVLPGGLLFWLIFGLIFGLIDKLKFVLIIALINVVGPMLITGMIAGLIAGMMAGDVRIHEKPNQGTWRSLATGMIAVLIAGLIIMLLVGLIVMLLDGLIVILLVVLFVGLTVGWGGWLARLFVGLGTFLRHFALRRLLAHYDYLPWRLVPFLEYAKERLLLRRVGGGYIFIHRTLQEYFASQDANFDQQNSRPSTGG